MAPSCWAPRAGYQACQQAVLTMGGMGYAMSTFHVERCLLREVLMTRIAPVTDQMILNFIAERVSFWPSEIVLTLSEVTFLTMPGLYFESSLLVKASNRFEVRRTVT